MTPVSHGTTGTSEWLNIPKMGRYRIDIDVPSGVTAISYTIQSKGPGATQPKIEKDPSDSSSTWTFTNESTGVIIDGPCDFRINVASRTGTGDVVISGVQVEGDC